MARIGTNILLFLSVSSAKKAGNVAGDLKLEKMPKGSKIDLPAWAIAQRAPIGIFRADAKGRILYINPALEAFSGVPLERALGNNWLLSIPQTERDIAERNWLNSLAARQSFETELRFNHPDGSIRYAAISVGAEEDPSGRVVGLDGFVSDVTDLRHRQQELARSERLFRLLAENAVDIIVRLDLDDHITYASPAMAEVTGFTSEETKGINPISFMHPDDAVNAKERSRQLKAGEVAQTVIEYRTPHKDGHFIWVEARSRLVRNDAGDPDEVISVVRDISAHKKLQAELIAAREAEQQALAAQQRFLAAMSHEIRTPISGVIGMIDLLINATDDRERPRYRAALESSARTLLRVVDDVLDYSRLSAVGVTLEECQFDVLAAVQGVMDLYRPAIEKKKLEFGLQFEATARHAIGDATRLCQVLGNLVSNALKFTEQGRIDIDVRQRNDRWTFAVSDTGIGISAAEQERIFHAFAQADERIAGRFGGTGLGLAIAQLIVNTTGGSITVKSAGGKGARFTFDMLLMMDIGKSKKSSGEKKRQMRAAELQILIADDNEVNLLYLTRLLERLGHRVTAAADGAAAVEAARAGTFDCILMDRHMPRMDGAEASRAIRELRPHNPCTIVLVSAAIPEIESANAVASELFDATISKPVCPKQLASILSACSRLRLVPESITVSSLRNETEKTLGIDATAKLDQLFRSDLGARIAKLEAAINARDHIMLKQQAHAIVGAAYLIGENVIGQAARSVETASEKTVIKVAIRLYEACCEYLSKATAVKPKGG